MSKKLTFNKVVKIKLIDLEDDYDRSDTHPLIRLNFQEASELKFFLKFLEKKNLEEQKHYASQQVNQRCMDSALEKELEKFIFSLHF
ncbi:hypothetical protein HK099_004655 [Clydaea vesicula]|uniref:Uncharacterized protein n=1 Tax=Clydaea vesicula TaxID=447962 RepID=A0AAD5U2S3_9FUNG|nr:hypothetical protein HK099_004655 [Clydaea vesicula]